MFRNLRLIVLALSRSMHLLWNIYLFPHFYGEWPLGSC